MTIITSELNVTELWNQSPCAGPYKRSDAAITREFIALQTKQRACDIVRNAPNWFGVPAGVLATLRRPSADGSGKLGKNGWTAELLVELPNGETQLLAGIGAGDVNKLPANALVRIVNVRPADPTAIVAHYSQTSFVRGSQRLPDGDRNPLTGSLLKPDAPVENKPDNKPETPAIVDVAPIIAEYAANGVMVDTDGVVTEPSPVVPFENRKTRRAKNKK